MRAIWGIIILIIAIGTVVTAYHISDVTGATFSEYGMAHIGHLTLAVLVVSMIGLSLVQLNWLRWHFLLRRYEIFLPTRQSVRLFWATHCLSYTPFRLGEIARAFILTGACKSPWGYALTLWGVLLLSDILIYGLIVGVLLSYTFLTAIVVSVLLLWYRYAWKVSRLKWLMEVQGVSIVIALLHGVSVWLLMLLLLGVSNEGMMALSVIGAQITLLGDMLLPAGVGLSGSLLFDMLQDSTKIHTISALLFIVIFYRIGMTWLPLCLSLYMAWRERRNIRNDGRNVQMHWDEFEHYDSEIPEHMRSRMLDKKINSTIKIFKDAPVDVTRILDIGCGTGHFAAYLIQKNYKVEGYEASQALREQAAENHPTLAVHALTDLMLHEHPDGSVDGVVLMNIMHHIIEDTQRHALYAEIVRVLRPGGYIILHEMNPRNPLFRLYMSYIFPLLKTIDEGTERWLTPVDLPEIEGGEWQDTIDYFTFFPDFLPQMVAHMLSSVEEKLEDSRLAPYSAHFCAHWIKT